MKDSEFLGPINERAAIVQTCKFLERASHKLQLMSVRQRMTVSEMDAQIGVIKKWLADLEEQVSGKATKVADKGK